MLLWVCMLTSVCACARAVLWVRCRGIYRGACCLPGAVLWVVGDSDDGWVKRVADELRLYEVLARLRCQLPAVQRTLPMLRVTMTPGGASPCLAT